MGNSETTCCGQCQAWLELAEAGAPRRTSGETDVGGSWRILTATVSISATAFENHSNDSIILRALCIFKASSFPDMMRREKEGEERKSKKKAYLKFSLSFEIQMVQARIQLRNSRIYHS